MERLRTGLGRTVSQFGPYLPTSVDMALLEKIGFVWFSDFRLATHNASIWEARNTAKHLLSFLAQNAYNQLHLNYSNSKA